MSINQTETTSEKDLIDLDNMSVSELFDKGWNLQQYLMKTSSDESSQDYMLKRKQAIEILEKCANGLDELHLFSTNESIDEVSTSEFRYFLNDALLGWLYSKVNSNLPQIRLVALEQAKNSITKYLKLTKNYELHNFSLEKFQRDSSNNPERVNNISSQTAFDANMINQAYERNEKIKRFKEQKEIESQLNLMNLTPHADEEFRRKLFKTSVKYWINKSVDDLKIIDDEINILKSIELEKKNRASTQETKNSSHLTAVSAPKKPFIITKDALQAKVFGAGYPSLPVYSVEEFYDQLADKGMMPKHQDPNENYAPVQIGKGVTESQKEDEKASKDLLEDAHDENTLKSQREWDEYKDEHKRGEGNRYNRS